MRNEYITLLQRMIQTPSVSGEENAVCTLLAGWMAAEGITVHRVGNNLWAECGEGPEIVLLNAHIDTVKPSPSYTRNPFDGECDGQTIYGLGANDDGGSVIAMLAVFMDMMHAPIPGKRIVLTLTAEEENSGRKGIELVLPEIGPIDYAIVGEPTSLEMAVAERGLLVLDCEAKGKAGHAAREEGINALYIALEDIQTLRNYEFEQVSPFLGKVKMTTTMIQAGTQHNVVPDTCHFVVDIRSNGLYTNEEILAILRPMLRSTITPRSTRLNASSTPLDTPVIQRAQALGIPIYGSPTMSNMALLSCPKVKFGPGDSSRSHTANEHIHIHEIEQAIELLKQLLIQNS
ncbi:MAG: M20/M25/M40 family metallo-hydrolase [Paludibacteraceae bacterium]|nr:M20/M25/M40 family metallo-hydrolase [Paludibacteraceae bacterium]